MPNTTLLNKKAFYRILPFLILFILPVITYCNTLNNDFVFDDMALIQGSKTLPSLQDASNIISVFTQKSGYRPIRTLSYAIDYHFSGVNPLSYHISNIVYHVITTLLVYLVTLSILSNRVTAFITALLFAVHPVHTDSVTYLAGRRDILCVLFYLMGFYFFLTYRKTGRLLLVPLSMAAYLLSLGSKEMGVTLPVLFFIYDMVHNLPQEGKESWMYALKEGVRTLKRVVRQYKYFYSFFLAGALTFTYYKVFISSPSHQEGYYGDSMWVTFLTVARIIVHYMKLLIFPVKLLADYSYDAFPLASSLFDVACPCIPYTACSDTFCSPETAHQKQVARLWGDLVFHYPFSRMPHYPPSRVTGRTLPVFTFLWFLPYSGSFIHPTAGKQKICFSHPPIVSSHCSSFLNKNH